jgi:hypothetical protein
LGETHDGVTQDCVLKTVNLKDGLCAVMAWDFFSCKKAKEGRKSWIGIWRRAANDGLGMA